MERKLIVVPHSSGSESEKDNNNLGANQASNYNSTNNTQLDASSLDTLSSNNVNIFASRDIFEAAQFPQESLALVPHTSPPTTSSTQDAPTTSVSPPSQPPKTSEPFSNLWDPVNFSDLAEKNLPPNENLVFKPNPMSPPQSNMNQNNPTDANKKDKTYIGLVFPKNISPLDQANANKQTTNKGYTLGPYIPPTTSTTTKSSTNAGDDLLYSPKSSPPLDAIPCLNASEKQLAAETSKTTGPSEPSTSGGITAGGRIPKLNKTSTSHHNLDGLNLKSLNLIETQKKYRQIENEIKQLQKKRNDIEKKINDMARSAGGKNIDFDPQFRQFKDDNIRLEHEIISGNKALDKISEFLLVEFNYKIAPQAPSQPVQKSHPQFKRARMSTTGKQQASKSNDSSEQNPLQKVMFDLTQDAKPYCQDCDHIFQSANEFCQHLHKREHAVNVKKHSTPWRSHKEVIDRSKTYNHLKSMIAKVDQESDNVFSLTELDKILIPNLSKEEYKSKLLARERGKFEDDDPLFDPKGFNYLLPITGYFCTLCHVALCDQPELNLHLRGYDHNMAYFRSVALNPLFETSYRHGLVKAFRNKYGRDATSSSFKRISNITRDTTIVTTSRDRNNSKSLTSSKDTFRDTLPLPLRREKQNITLRQSKLPEILPLSKERAKPSALKRLRSEGSSELTHTRSPEKKRKDKVVESDDDIVEILDHENDARSERMMEDDSEQVNDLTEQIILSPGDPDSPYPEYKLMMSGNYHIDLLKDKRLAQKSKIVLKKLDLNEYKDMILDRSSLWDRVNGLLTKAEKPSFCDKTTHLERDVAATFFVHNGDLLPVDLDKEERKRRNPNVKVELENERRRRKTVEKRSDRIREDDESDETNRRKKSNETDDDKIRDKGKSSPGSNKSRAREKYKEGVREDSPSPSADKPDDTSDGSPKPGISMNFLETFFID